MSLANQSHTNITVTQFQQMLGIVLFSITTALPCCVFLFINGTLLYTLRSKPVFRETCRYVLLYNLLFADTLQLALGQLLYIIAACRITLTYPVCGVFVVTSNAATVISPLTLVVMCLERYVAVCYPLRHAAIVTVTNTAAVIVVVWAFSSLNLLIRVLLLLEFPFAELETLQMKELCTDIAMLLGQLSDVYDKAFTYFLFVSAGVTIMSSYIGVIIAARSASTDKASARKARNTLLLHLVQLGLSLLSTLHSSLLVAISETLTRVLFTRLYNVIYVCFILSPRCLSSLIYGLRDQSIRPVFMYHLCCRIKLSVVPDKNEPVHLAD